MVDYEDELRMGGRYGNITTEHIERWENDGTFDRIRAVDQICRGALQLVAARLLDQATQISAGEQELYGGVRRLEEARNKIRDRRV